MSKYLSRNTLDSTFSKVERFILNSCLSHNNVCFDIGIPAYPTFDDSIQCTCIIHIQTFENKLLFSFGLLYKVEKKFEQKIARRPFLWHLSTS